MCGSITCATCTTHLPRPRYVRTPHKLPNSHSPSSTGSAKKQTEKAIFWNFWVLLALPWNWLAWSVLSVIVAIMTFVWRTGASTLSAHARDIYQYHVLARPRPFVTQRRGAVTCLQRHCRIESMRGLSHGGGGVDGACEVQKEFRFPA